MVPRGRLNGIQSVSLSVSPPLLSAVGEAKRLKRVRAWRVCVCVYVGEPVKMDILNKHGGAICIATDANFKDQLNWHAMRSGDPAFVDGQAAPAGSFGKVRSAAEQYNAAQLMAWSSIAEHIKVCLFVCKH